jgi:hypothetical protein
MTNPPESTLRSATEIIAADRSCPAMVFDSPTPYCTSQNPCACRAAAYAILSTAPTAQQKEPAQ